ncbi:hypothetical protein [Prescottella subtropica]|uniref:hypothetical protein n=1 Tax=Prescottella subtropica TaxID=2545757 RepID=UPI0010F64C4C|nr:hypothetical protein [Prescottella subtropica]
MIFTSKRRGRGGTQPSSPVPAEGADTGADAGDPDAISVTARWMVLTTSVGHGFARALLPDSFEVSGRPQLAVWMVEPMSATSDAVGVPVGRMFAGMSCSGLLRGESTESAFTSDLLVGAPIVDTDRDPFALPALAQSSLRLVNGVGGMGFSITPVDGGGRGVVGRVELDGEEGGAEQLTPDWLADQWWRPDLVGGGTVGGVGELVRTRWDVTRLSPVVTGRAVVECADFGEHSYDLSGSSSLAARYGFARVSIAGRP